MTIKDSQALKEEVDKSVVVTLNTKPVTKEELKEQIDQADGQPGISIRHEGGGHFRRKISG
jgi:hypothetical protein